MGKAIQTTTNTAETAPKPNRNIAVLMDSRETVSGKTKKVDYSYRWIRTEKVDSDNLRQAIETLTASGTEFFTAQVTIDEQPDFEMLLVPEKKRICIDWTISKTWGWVDGQTVRDAVYAWADKSEEFTVVHEM